VFELGRKEVKEKQPLDAGDQLQGFAWMWRAVLRWPTVGARVGREAALD
jgi:hypothetical protein